MKMVYEDAVSDPTLLWESDLSLSNILPTKLCLMIMESVRVLILYDFLLCFCK